MTRIAVGVGVVAMAASAIAAGCGGGSEERGGGSAPGASAAPAVTAQAGTPALEIIFRADPGPVTMGENTFEVIVTQDGQPVTDAGVSTEFFMAAMPSMNMPEMRTRADLMHEGSGTYRGNGQVMMAGDWDVTVTVTRGDQEIGSRTMTLTAR